MSSRRVPRGDLGTAAVLLKDFPIGLHRAMKAAAAQSGRRVTELYAEACTMFLRAARPRKGGERR